MHAASNTHTTKPNISSLESGCRTRCTIMQTECTVSVNRFRPFMDGDRAKYQRIMCCPRTVTTVVIRHSRSMESTCFSDISFGQRPWTAGNGFRSRPNSNMDGHQTDTVFIRNRRIPLSPMQEMSTFLHWQRIKIHLTVQRHEQSGKVQYNLASGVGRLDTQWKVPQRRPGDVRKQPLVQFCRRTTSATTGGYLCQWRIARTVYTTVRLTLNS